MAYRIENGKLYEVKEVSVAELEKEVKQAAAFIKECDNKEKPYLNAIASKKNELKNIKEKYEREIASYQSFIDEQEKKKDEAKAKLLDKKDIIAQLYPSESNFLGF